MILTVRDQSGHALPMTSEPTSQTVTVSRSAYTVDRVDIYDVQLDAYWAGALDSTDAVATLATVTGLPVDVLESIVYDVLHVDDTGISTWEVPV